MPKRATKFRDVWLNLLGTNGTEIKEWCTKGKDDFTVWCTLCKTAVNVSNSGKIQLFQHAATGKHKSRDAKKKDSSQSRLVTSQESNSVYLLKPDSEKKKNLSSWTLNPEDRICRSEILWIIHVALCNYSFSSCDSVKKLFNAMFEDSSLPQSLSLSSRKVSYAISHGLGPYFLKQITDTFQNEAPYFTLMYDETLNEQNLKQLDVLVRYWDAKSNCIQERYIGSELLGHATALDIASSIMNILQSSKISLKNLIMLGSDGPNVNKLVFQLIDKEVKLIRKSGLISVGTCNLHVIHNAFGKGITCESFSNVVDFIENIYYWFAKFPSRQEDLKRTMENFNTEFVKILKFVSNRWLSVVGVCQRALDLFPVMKIYFLEDLPKENNRLTKNDRYLCIRKMLKSPLTSIYLSFMISVGSMFEEILKLLQEKSTLIHILYDELSKLVLKLMRRFVNDTILKDKYGEELIHVDVRKEAVSLKCIDIGSITKKLMTEQELSPELKNNFLADAKEFYIVITSYLQEKLPLKNKLLRCLKILHPIIRKEPAKLTVPSVRRLATMLPGVISEDCVDKLTD